MTFKPERTMDAHRQVAFSRAGKAIVAAAVILNLLFGVWPTALLDAAVRSARTLSRETVSAADGR
jgi:hypothetical protein